jgi:hypothetical protein
MTSCELDEEYFFPEGATGAITGPWILSPKVRNSNNRQKVKLAKFQNWKCFWCKQHCVNTTEHMNSITVEHVVPVSKGGPSQTWNLVMACYRCNSQRSSIPAEEFEVVAAKLLPNTDLIIKSRIVMKQLARNRKKQRVMRQLDANRCYRGLWVYSLTMPILWYSRAALSLISRASIKQLTAVAIAPDTRLKIFSMWVAFPLR